MKYIIIFCVATVLVLGMHILYNYKSYISGQNWKPGLIFNLLLIGSGFIGYVIANELLIKRIKWVRSPQLYFIGFGILSMIYGVLLMILMVSVWVFWHHQPFPGPGILINNCIHSALVCLAMGLVIIGIDFQVQTRKEVTDRQKLQKEMVQSQFEVLKAQINPHFLFNSLNTLVGLVPEQPETAQKFIRQLSSILRYTLESSKENIVPLERELAIVESYIFLNRQRYGEKLDFRNMIERNTTGSKKILGQVLLMLVENAIKHNELSHENPLHLSIGIDEEDYLVVDNNVQIKSTLESHTGMGLDNIRRRYELVTDKRLVIEDANGHFIIKVPLLS